MPVGSRDVLIVRTWMLRIVLGVTLFLVVAGGWLLYSWGGTDAARELQELRAQRERLEQRVEVLETRNAELTRQQAMLERARQVDQEAYSDYRRSRAELEESVSRLREELAFYRGIMAPEREEEGLHAQSFEVEPLARPGHVKVRLVMVYMGRHERFRKGSLALEVTGIRQGSQESYTHADLSVQDDAGLEYGFRYFQVFEREWALPEGFQARQIEVRADPAGREETQRWTFPWPADATSTTQEADDVG